jgi:hypothetical protein
MQTKLELVTPRIAAQWLATVVDNRPSRNGWVEYLTGEILRGKWRVTHQGIAFDNDGHLFDGEHRCRAIVKADRPVEMNVTRGADRETYSIIDSGLTRSTGDRIKLVSDPAQNQAVCAIVRSYIKSTGPSSKGNRIPIDIIEGAFLKMADAFVWTASRWTHKIPGLTRSDIGAGVAGYAHARPEQAEEFVNRFMDLEHAPIGDGASVLRNALYMRRIGYGNISDAYWKTISATKAHAEHRNMRALMPASVDWQNNRFSPSTSGRGINKTRKGRSGNQPGAQRDGAS